MPKDILCAHTPSQVLTVTPHFTRSHMPSRALSHTPLHPPQRLHSCIHFSFILVNSSPSKLGYICVTMHNRLAVGMRLHSVINHDGMQMQAGLESTKIPKHIHLVSKKKKFQSLHYINSAAVK